MMFAFAVAPDTAALQTPFPIRGDDDQTFLARTRIHLGLRRRPDALFFRTVRRQTRRQQLTATMICQHQPGWACREPNNRPHGMADGPAEQEVARRFESSSARYCGAFTSAVDGAGDSARRHWHAHQARMARKEAMKRGPLISSSHLSTGRFSSVLKVAAAEFHSTGGMIGCYAAVAHSTAQALRPVA